MATPGPGPIPAEPDPGIDRRDSLPPPRSPAQPSRPTSPAQGSTGSSSTAVNTKVYDRVKPTAIVKRYERSTRLEPPFINVNLSPLTTSFSDGEEPQGWTPLAHPEGALYWVYEWREDGKVMPAYTDAYLYKKETLEEIEKFRQAIFGEILNRAGSMPAEWELVLDLVDEEGLNERICYYYFVNSSNRSLFWLHYYDVTPLLYGLSDVKSKRRIHQALESFYWNHWEMFPHNREVPEKLLKELVGIMVHAGLDDMTSHGSTSVYSGDELQKFISYVERIRFIGGADGYSACVVGRLMKFFAQGRYINFFGQREARLSTDQSIFGDEDKKKRTWLIKSMSFLMFFAPEVHLKALDVVYTDFVVCQHKWAKFICKVQNEWRELGRIGTVLLTANVAFLAIPSVDNVPGNLTNEVSAGGYPRTPAQVTSFMSVVFSMGCVVIGQLLLRRHMIRPQESAEEVDKYLRNYHDTHRGLETLAILYSLPYSLLLWAIASFFVAFVFVALVDSEGKWQRYPTAVVMFIFVVLLIWCIWTTWEGRADFVEYVRHLVRSSPTPGQGEHRPLQPNKDHPEQHDSRATSQISIRVDPTSRSN